MALPTAEIQTGLISRYTADSTLTAMLASTSAVYDAGGVPINQPFPYIVLYPITSQVGTAITMEMDAVDPWIQVSIFTQTGATGGFSLARRIAKRIYVLTNRQALDLSADSFSNFFVMFENEQELPQQDGITQLIAQRYKLMTQG